MIDYVINLLWSRLNILRNDLIHTSCVPQTTTEMLSFRRIMGFSCSSSPSSHLSQSSLIRLKIKLISFLSSPHLFHILPHPSMTCYILYIFYYEAFLVGFSSVRINLITMDYIYNKIYFKPCHTHTHKWSKDHHREPK